MAHLSKETIAHQVASAIESGHLTADSPALMAYDLGVLRARVRELKLEFPPGTLHALAVKAFALPGLLEHVYSAGVGAEVASSGELALALDAGVNAAHIVFDSPCKTDSEIRNALELGVMINADSIEEWRLLHAHAREIRTSSVLGLRINPQVGAGSIAQTSVATADSKFGEPLGLSRAMIVDCLKAADDAVMLHCHVGSQGTNVELLRAAARSLVDLASDIGWSKVSTIDIGGGLPIDYGAELIGSVTLAEYLLMLRVEAPELFDGRVRLVTEFGRWVFGPSAWTASRVEGVKSAGSTTYAVTHVGADLFLRAAYRPDNWKHEVIVLDSSGTPKTGPLLAQSIAGPLCFSGDIIAHDRMLPRIDPGDLIVVLDTGAYTLSMVSRYNSRPMPEVLAFDDGVVSVLRPKETPSDVVRFWRGGI